MRKNKKGQWVSSELPEETFWLLRRLQRLKVLAAEMSLLKNHQKAKFGKTKREILKKDKPLNQSKYWKQ